MIKDVLSFRNRLREEDRRIQRVLANAGFVGEDEHIRAVKDSPGNVLSLLSGSNRIARNEAFQHLGLEEHRHCGLIGRLNHPLLGNHELLRFEVD